MDDPNMRPADRQVIVHFRDGETGEIAGPQMALPYDLTRAQLAEVVRSLTGASDSQPYSLFLGDDEIVRNLSDSMDAAALSSEAVVSITFQPEAVFRVRSVGRCTSTLPGHSEAILHVQFSPDGAHLATGSGDTTVRIWEVGAEMPLHTLRAHKNWVMSVAWSPDGSRLVSGDKNGAIQIWDPLAGIGCPRRPLPRGHTKWITAFAWQPSFLGEALQFASASKDGTVRVWNSAGAALVRILSGHTACVTCIRWGGDNVLYSGSQDRTIRCWNPETGVLIRVLYGHAHWVNSLSLSSDYVLRTGPFDHRGQAGPDRCQAARQRYEALGDDQRLISCSDDFTLFLWRPAKSDKPIARLTGHQQPVNHILFSPDGRLIASAAFDHSIRIWDGITGRFMAALRGHVQAVYSVAWSADSRLLVSGSRDSTVKVWEIRTKKLLNDLPGHADEVFALDWSPDGERVASGGRDRVVKFWRR